jgi:hypothetical protein
MPNAVTGDIAVLHELLDEALEDLVVSDEERVLAQLPASQPEPRAVVNRDITDLSAARGQTARLHARWIDLRDHIGPF